MMNDENKTVNRCFNLLGTDVAARLDFTLE